MRSVSCLVLALLASSGAAQTNQTAPPYEFPNTFRIVVLPDSQFYTYPKLSGPDAGTYPNGTNGLPAMFNAQTQWIHDNATAKKIQYVAHVGDMSEHGDFYADATQSGPVCDAGTANANTIEWDNIETAMDNLENPLIPYGVAVGNHDTSPQNGGPNPPNTGGSGAELTVGPTTTNCFEKYFGVAKFSTGHSYYGGHYGSNNFNHYDLITPPSGPQYLFIYVQYDDNGCNAGDDSCVVCPPPPATQPPGCTSKFVGGQPNYGPKEQNQSALYSWLSGVLTSYPCYNKVVVSHYIGDTSNPSSFGQQGSKLYSLIQGDKNAVMMLSGHISGTYNGSGRRQDITALDTGTSYTGSLISTLVSDYQADEYVTGHDGSGNPISTPDGGNGYMRIYDIAPDGDSITASTYSPYLDAAGLANQPANKLNPRDAFRVQMHWKSRADVFYQDATSTLSRDHWDNVNQVWVGDGNVTNAGGKVGLGMTSNPVAISRGNQMLDVFYQVQGGKLEWAFFDGNVWTERDVKDSSGNAIVPANPPAAVAVGLNSMKVMWQGTNHHLIVTSWDGTSWSLPSDHTATVYSAPTAISSTPKHIEVAYTDNAGALRRMAWIEDLDETGGCWLTEQSLAKPTGVTLQDKPGIDSTAGKLLTVFAHGLNGAGQNDIYSTSYSVTYNSTASTCGAVTATTTAAWSQVTTSHDVGGGPTAASWGPTRQDVVYKISGGTGAVRHFYFDGTSWHNDSLPGTTAGGPTIASWSHFY